MAKGKQPATAGQQHQQHTPPEAKPVRGRCAGQLISKLRARRQRTAAYVVCSEGAEASGSRCSHTSTPVASSLTAATRPGAGLGPEPGPSGTSHLTSGTHGAAAPTTVEPPDLVTSPVLHLLDLPAVAVDLRGLAACFPAMESLMILDGDKLCAPDRQELVQGQPAAAPLRGVRPLAILGGPTSCEDYGRALNDLAAAPVSSAPYAAPTLASACVGGKHNGGQDAQQPETQMPVELAYLVELDDVDQLRMLHLAAMPVTWPEGQLPHLARLRRLRHVMLLASGPFGHLHAAELSPEQGRTGQGIDAGLRATTQHLGHGGEGGEVPHAHGIQHNNLDTQPSQLVVQPLVQPPQAPAVLLDDAEITQLYDLPPGGGDAAAGGAPPPAASAATGSRPAQQQHLEVWTLAKLQPLTAIKSLRTLWLSNGDTPLGPSQLQDMQAGLVRGGCVKVTVKDAAPEWFCRWPTAVGSCADEVDPLEWWRLHGWRVL